MHNLSGPGGNIPGWNLVSRGVEISVGATQVYDFTTELHCSDAIASAVLSNVRLTITGMKEAGHLG